MTKTRQDYRKASEAEPPLLALNKPIAIVDDSPDDLLFLKREIQFIFGCVPILGFEKGPDLLLYLQTLTVADQKPWMILLDLDMPGTNGFGTLELLNKDPSASAIPVVIVSGTPNERDVHNSFLSGAKAFLPKPVSRQAFAALLHQGSLFKSALHQDAIVRVVAVSGCA